MGNRGAKSRLAPAPTPPTPPKPQSAMDTTNLHELAEYMKTVGSGSLVLDEQSLSGAVFENVRGAAAAVEQVIKEFPQAEGRFHVLRGSDLHKGVFACASYGGVIELGNDYYGKTESDFGSLYAKNVNNGFHPAGTGKDHIATHEAGHLLERALIQKYILSQGNDFYTRLEASAAWSSSKMASKVVSEACKAAKKTPEGKGLKNEELIKAVSRYATKSRSEALAECVADYTANGSNAKPLSVAVWSILKRELG